MRQDENLNTKPKQSTQKGHLYVVAGVRGETEHTHKDLNNRLGFGNDGRAMRQDVNLNMKSKQSTRKGHNL